MAMIEYHGEIKQITGTGRDCISAKSVSGLLKEIRKMYGAEAYQSAKSSHIVVNGEPAAKQGGFRCSLQDDDTVQLFPVCAGG